MVQACIRLAHVLYALGDLCDQVSLCDQGDNCQVVGVPCGGQKLPCDQEEVLCGQVALCGWEVPLWNENLELLDGGLQIQEVSAADHEKYVEEVHDDLVVHL